MHTAVYKYQIGQNVYIIDPDEDELKSGTILQVSIDIYRESMLGIEMENTYIIHLTSGLDCSENIECPERNVYETLSLAASALQSHVGDA